jgi:hypothetical protein
MKKRKPAAKSAALSATRRREELEAVSGVERKKPVPPAAPPDKGRAGRKGVVIYLDPIAKELLAQLAHQHRKSLQELGIEAFNHLFRAYGQKPIA